MFLRDGKGAGKQSQKRFLATGGEGDRAGYGAKGMQVYHREFRGRRSKSADVFRSRRTQSSKPRGTSFLGSHSAVCQK